MQPEVKLKFCCVACDEQTGVIRYVGAVGFVCTGCHRRLGPFSRLVDCAESLSCDPANEQSVHRFRRIIRALQRLGQRYKVIDDGNARRLEITEDTRRRKLVLEKYPSQEQAIITLLREHVAVRPPQKSNRA